jgi:hypothetical protein
MSLLFRAYAEEANGMGIIIDTKPETNGTVAEIGTKN